MAVENGVQNAELGYLLFPFEQYSNLAGKPLVGGHMEIYEAGTDTKYISYQNWDGAENPFRIPIPNDGRITVLADPTKTFDCYLYDSYNNLVCSRLNVQANVPGNISIKGADTILKNTDGTLDIYLRTLGNNVREYTVNTHNKVLDVQSPLYFVENSNTATVIGFSGDYATTADVAAKLDTTAFSAVSGDFLTDKFEYDDNFNITGYDGSAFASNGQTYSAGTNIDITDNIISVTGLPTSSDIENAVSSAVTNVENKFEYNENNYITAYNNSAFAGTNYSAGDYVSIENDTISVTGLQPSGDYATHDDLTAYATTSLVSSVSAEITAAIPTGDYLTKASADTLYYGIDNPSGFITGVDLSDYATTAEVAEKLDTTAFSNVSGEFYTTDNPSGFITGVDLSPYQTTAGMTAFATTALVSSISAELYSAVSSISGDYELVAGSGVELVDDPNAKTTTINVTAEGTPVTAIEQMIESATSGLQPSGDYATTTQVAEKLDTTAFSTVSGSFLTAHQDLSDYATTAELANKLDTSAFSDVSGTFLTAHQDISNKLDTTAFSNVSGDFLTAVPDTYLQNTDLTISDNKITEISGIPLSAGDELPSGLMNESGLEYNAVNEISGYNGSAFAQYGHEAQWLVHDDTLVHAANSAQYALGVNLSAVAQLLGVDETVLYSGASTTAFTLSEPMTSFEKIQLGVISNGERSMVYVPVDAPVGYTLSSTLRFAGMNYMHSNDGAPLQTFGAEYSSNNGTSFTAVRGQIRAFYYTGSGMWYAQSIPGIYKVIGIGRRNNT